MNGVNKTLYIPLYGKAYVSGKGIILQDTKAQEIWSREGFLLKGKSKSKWLAYYMGMRSAVFDNWVREQLSDAENTVILHIGCGMDSRCERVGVKEYPWYDVDFPEVIKERKRYYRESEQYHMISADARKTDWLKELPRGNAVVIMEGISMYFTNEELGKLCHALQEHFSSLHLLMDCYTTLAAKASKYKNPINEVGVTVVYGMDEPRLLEKATGLHFVKEHDMTPPALIEELEGMEKLLFKYIFGGKISKKMYRLYEYIK